MKFGRQSDPQNAIGSDSSLGRFNFLGIGEDGSLTEFHLSCQGSGCGSDGGVRSDVARLRALAQAFVQERGCESLHPTEHTPHRTMTER